MKHKHILPKTTPSFPPAPDPALIYCKTTEKRGQLQGGTTKSSFAHAYPREKGEEVVFLVVDDISRVSLVPLLWVPKPDRPRPRVPPPTASQALAAPAEGPAIH